jgi:glutaminase
LKCFIELGIDVNCSDYDKRTALHLAEAKKIPKTIELLINLGATSQNKDRWGKSALDYAKENKNQEVLAIFNQEEKSESSPLIE